MINPIPKYGIYTYGFPSPKLIPEAKPAIVLDIDKTIRHSKQDPEGFIQDLKDIALYPGVEEVLWKWRQDGYLIVGVSNQGGVAFGYKTAQDIEKQMAATVRLFRDNPINAILVAFPYEGGKEPLSTKPLRHYSFLRKPRYGMLVLAEILAWEAGFMIKWKDSIVVGDQHEDEELYKRAKLLRYEHPETFFELPLEE